MPRFKVLVGRDARVYYSAEVEAESVQAAKALLGRDGYAAPQGTVWTQEAVAPFDNVETCDIFNESDVEVAHYEDGEGWG